MPKTITKNNHFQEVPQAGVARLVSIPDLGALAYLAVKSHFLCYRDCFRIVMSKFFTIERYIAQTPIP